LAFLWAPPEGGLAPLESVPEPPPPPFPLPPPVPVGPDPVEPPPPPVASVSPGVGFEAIPPDPPPPSAAVEEVELDEEPQPPVASAAPKQATAQSSASGFPISLFPGNLPPRPALARRANTSFLKREKE
jgi:hypothetical protein